MDFKNFRFNPKTGLYVPKAIAGEIHTVSLMEEQGIYGIILHEIPYYENPSNVIINENVTGGVSFTEVPKAATPGATEYWVDYANRQGDYGMAIVGFNAAADGTEVVVDYKGLGTTLKDRYQLKQNTVIPTNFGVEGNTEVTDSISIGTGTGGGNATVSGNGIFGGKISVADDPAADDEVGDRKFNDGRYIIPAVGGIITPDFSVSEFFDIPTGTVDTVDDSGTAFGTTTTLRFDGNGINRHVFKPGGAGDSNFGRLFPMPVSGFLPTFELQVRKDGTFDGDFNVRVRTFDANLNTLDTISNLIPNAALTTSYQLFSIRSNYATSGAKYYAVQIQTQSGSTGKAYVPYFQHGIFSMQPGGLQTVLTALGGYTYNQASGTRGALAGFIQVDQGVINLTSSYANYDLDGSEYYPNQAKLLIAEVYISGTAPVTIFHVDANDQTSNYSIASGSLASVTISTIIPMMVYGHDLNANGKSNFRAKENSGAIGNITPLGFFI